jgi:hypothetical protein
MDYYEPHPMLGMFPEANEYDRRSMERAVEESGVQQPIVVWKDAKARMWVVDGRTRQAAALAVYNKLTKDGKDPLAENGRPIQPQTFEFVATADELLDYMKRTHIRKHYSPGQKSAMGVRVYYYELLKLNGKKKVPDDVDDEMKWDGALTAEQLADVWGTNHYYIRICKMLFRKAADLLDAVAAGMIPPAKARAQLNERMNGTAVDEEGDPEAPGEAPEVTDGHGKEVPPHLVEKFRARASFRAFDRTISTAMKQVETLSQNPGGEFIDVGALTKVLRVARNQAKKVQPEEPCGACDGKGHLPGQRHKCKKCMGHGFLCKMILKAAMTPAGAGAAAGGGEGDDET